MRNRVWFVLALLALTAPAYARADETTFGVAITGTHGTHREGGGVAKAPLVPAPVLAVSHRFKRFEIVAEGLPPIGAIPVSNNGLGMQSIALTYGDATLRYWNKRQTFAVGIGETLYNQRTQFLQFEDSFMQANTVNASRVTGTRYEMLEHIALPGRNFVEAQFAVDPAMHGRFIFEERTTYPTRGRSYTYTAPPEWERASQVDANVRFVHPFGPFALSYGVRYLNYTASFTRPAGWGPAGWPAFADANSFLMPYIAIQRSWGH